MKRKSIFLILSLLLTLTVSAQKLTVESMKAAGNDISASQYERKDLNGQACALVKVLLPMPGAVFEGNVIGNVDFKTGEYWVYMTAGSKELRIKHPQAQPVQAVFKDYGVDRLTSKTTYMLSVLLPQAAVTQTQKLVIKYSPANATVLVDSKLQQGNGHIEIELPVGSHDYIIAANGYETAEGSVKLTAGSPRTITENLNRTAIQQAATNNVQQQTAVQQPAQQYSQQQTQQYTQQQSSVSQTSSSSANMDLSVREVKAFEHISGPALQSYGVVVASFSVLANAKDRADILVTDGFTPTIIKESSGIGMYRVIAVTTNDKGQAASQRDVLRSKYVDSWVIYNPNASGSTNTTSTPKFWMESFTFRSGEIFDKASNLTEKGKTALEKVALVLQENPQTRLSVKYSMGKYKGKNAYEKAYYKARSQEFRFSNIRKFLIGLGISQDRITNDGMLSDDDIDAILLVQ